MTNYGFSGRLTEAFPSQVIVDVCEICNYKCIHCPQSQFKHNGAFSGAVLSEKLNKKLVKEVAEHGKGLTQQIRYTAAGEPFLHPEIMNFLEYAVKNSGTMVSVTTNGSLLNNEKINRLLEINIGLIDFSLDALNEDTYKDIRKNGDLTVVRGNLINMLKMKKKMNSSTRIVVSFVEQEKNASEANAFKRFWEDAGVDYVVLRKLHSAGGFFKNVNDKQPGIKPCVYPWERILLNARGELDLCAMSWEGKTVIHSNYNDTTIREVWSGTEYSILRNEHINCMFERFKVCGKCPDRNLTIWPGNKTESIRGYGDMISDFSSEDKYK